MRLQKKRTGRAHVTMILVLTMLMASVVQGVDAKKSKPNNYHFWSLGFGAGYSTLLEDYTDLNTIGSVGLDLHFGYEYENQGFWISPMIELQYLSCDATSAINISNMRIIDTQGKTQGGYQWLDMQYDVTSPLTENIRLFYLNFPIMVGYYSHDGFYFGAGFRLGFNLGLNSSAHFTYSTTGRYLAGENDDMYFEDFHDMPNHFYTNYKAVNDTVHYGSVFKVSAIAEIGYDLMASLHRSKVKYSALKIGGFVEYGLNNVINTEGSGKTCSINPNNYSILVPQTYYSAHHTNNHRVVPLYAGVRVTWLFYHKGKGAYCPRCKRRYY